MNRIFEIPDANLPAFEKAMKRITRKTGQLIRWLPIGRFVKDGIGYTKVRIYAHKVPEFNGWKFIARIERNDKRNIVISKEDIQVDPSWYEKSIVNHCDHCGYNRKRNIAYIIEKDGERKIVGSACVKDFFGGLDPAAVAAFFETFKNIESRVQAFRNVRKADFKDFFPAKEFVAAQVAYFLSTGFLYQHYVVSDVAYFFANNPDIKGVCICYNEITEENIRIGWQVADRILNTEYGDDNKLNNLISVLRDGVIERKKILKVFNSDLLQKLVEVIKEVAPDHPRFQPEKKEFDELHYGRVRQTYGKENAVELELHETKVTVNGYKLLVFKLWENNRAYRIVSFDKKQWDAIKRQGWKKGKKFKAQFKVLNHKEWREEKSTVVKLLTLDPA